MERSSLKTQHSTVWASLRAALRYFSIPRNPMKPYFLHFVDTWYFCTCSLFLPFSSIEFIFYRSVERCGQDFATDSVVRRLFFHSLLLSYVCRSACIHAASKFVQVSSYLDPRAMLRNLKAEIPSPSLKATSKLIIDTPTDQPTDRPAK